MPNIEKNGPPNAISTMTNLREYIVLSPFYFVSVGVLYLWGYWSPFGVNILEYANLADIVRMTALPIASSFLAVAIGVAIEPFTRGSSLPPGGGKDTPTGQFLNKHEPRLILLWWTIVGLIFYFSPVEKWVVLPIFIAIPLALALRNKQFLTDLIPTDDTNRAIVFLLCALPFYAYGFGTINAHRIMTGDKYTTVELTPERTFGKNGMANGPQQYRYLGVANNFVFLMPMEEQSVIVASFERVQPLYLKPYVKQERPAVAKPPDPAPAIPLAPKVAPARHDTPASNRHQPVPAR